MDSCLLELPRHASGPWLSAPRCGASRFALSSRRRAPALCLRLVAWVRTRTQPLADLYSASGDASVQIPLTVKRRARVRARLASSTTLAFCLAALNQFYLGLRPWSARLCRASPAGPHRGPRPRTVASPSLRSASCQAVLPLPCRAVSIN